MSLINCTAIKRKKEDELKSFADVVHGNMNGVAVYAPFQNAVTEMYVAAEAYQVAWTQSRSRDTEKIRLKNVAKDLFFNLMNRIAKLMDAEWFNNEQDYLKTQAGFTLYKASSHEKVTYVNPPTNFVVYNDKRTTVLIAKWTKAAHAVTTAFETQINDAACVNGTYSEKESLELTFPKGTKLSIRSRTIGPNNLTSVFTEILTVYVD